MGQPALGYIMLANSDLSDVGLERLATLPSLVYLDASKTKVTVEAVKKFHAALPACQSSARMARSRQSRHPNVNDQRVFRFRESKRRQVARLSLC